MNGVPTPGAITYSSVAGAITGVILWVLQTYAFNGGSVPGPIEGAAWVLIPAIVTGAASFFTRRNTTAPATPAPAPAPEPAPKP